MFGQVCPKKTLHCLAAAFVCALTARATSAQPYVPTAALAEGDAHDWRRLHEMLATPVALDADEAPLASAVDYLRTRYGLDISIDARALDSLGLAPSEPISVRVRGDLIRAFDEMLRPIELSWIVAHGALVITTKNEAQTVLITRTYPAPDLVDSSNEQRGADIDSLIDAIISTIAPETWAENGGGDADVRWLPSANTLVISQTVQVHLQIDRLLAQIRRDRAAQGLWVYEDERGVSRSSGGAKRRVRKYVTAPGAWRTPRVYSASGR